MIHATERAIENILGNRNKGLRDDTYQDFNGTNATNLVVYNELDNIPNCPTCLDKLIKALAKSHFVNHKD